MNDEGVFRTAPATLGLLNILDTGYRKECKKYKKSMIFFFFNYTYHVCQIIGKKTNTFNIQERIKTHPVCKKEYRHILHIRKNTNTSCLY